MTDFEAQISTLLPLLTLEQKESALELLRLLTAGVGSDCPQGQAAKAQV